MSSPRYMREPTHAVSSGEICVSSTDCSTSLTSGSNCSVSIAQRMMKRTSVLGTEALTE